MNSIIFSNISQKLFKTSYFLCPCLQVFHAKKTYLSSTLNNISSITLENADSLKNKRINPSRAYSEGGVFKRVANKIYSAYGDATKCKIGAALTYERCADSINYQTFFKYLNLPDTFYSWFLVIELHVWMISIAFIAEKNGRVFRNGVITEMWNDVELRVERLAVIKSANKRKYIQELVDRFQTSLIAYDEGALDEDKILAGAIWRTLFSFNKEVDPRVLGALVLYVRKQIHHLETIPTDDLTFYGKLTLIPFEEIIKEVDFPLKE